MEQKLPRHVAVIPDGNRRWAKKHRLPMPTGYLEGEKRFHEISQAAFDMGVSYLTFWAMSEDNFRKRSRTEINFLVALMKKILRNRIMENVLKNKIHFRVLGNWRKTIDNKGLSELIDGFEKQTQKFKEHNLTIMLAYSGEQELVDTITANLFNWPPEHQWETSGLDFEKIRKAAFQTKDLPRVDLEIRAGEEMPNWFHNSSGFMMLHTTDSEIRATPTLWPDFSVEEFKQIVAEYGQRERKFGR